MTDYNTAIVWTRPGCQACRITIKMLTGGGVQVRPQALTDEAADKFRKEGHMQLPVVEYMGTVWSGLRPDVINQYVN